MLRVVCWPGQGLSQADLGQRAPLNAKHWPRGKASCSARAHICAVLARKWLPPLPTQPTRSPSGHRRASCQPACEDKTGSPTPNRHTWLLLRHSFQVTTLVMSSTDRPNRAAPTLPMPSEPPKIQSSTVVPRAPAVIFSFRDRGPSFCSSSLCRHGKLRIQAMAACDGPRPGACTEVDTATGSQLWADHSLGRMQGCKADGCQSAADSCTLQCREFVCRAQSCAGSGC